MVAILPYMLWKVGLSRTLNAPISALGMDGEGTKLQSRLKVPSK